METWGRGFTNWGRVSPYPKMPNQSNLAGITKKNPHNLTLDKIPANASEGDILNIYTIYDHRICAFCNKQIKREQTKTRQLLSMLILSMLKCCIK